MKPLRALFTGKGPLVSGTSVSGKLIMAGFVLAASLAAAPVGAVSLLADYQGFDYQPTKVGPGFGDVGNTYEVLSTVPQLGAPLVFNLGANQYTVVISGLTSTSKVSLGTYDIIGYAGGTVSIYEDAIGGGTPATYGINPANATAPSTFIDGTNILVGGLSGFQVVYDNATRTGSFEGNLTFSGGSQLGNIPVNQRAGWTFAGVTGNSPILPQGYLHQVDGSIYLDNPVAVQTTTWGSVKALYAR